MNETNEIVLTPCDSSFISGYLYNDSVWVFTIQFRNGPTKAYQEVEPEVYEDFLAAESKGKWFNAVMKHKYQSLVIEEGLAVAPVPAETEVQIGISRKSIPSSVPEDATCQEASVLSREKYIACGKTAVAVVDNGDTNVYFMCRSCADHNCRNRGGKLLLMRYSNIVDDEPDPTISTEITVVPSEGDAETLPPLEPPTTINDALKMLNENAGLIAATVEQNGRIAKAASALTVTDAASYERAGNEVLFLKAVIERTSGFLEPIKSLLYRPYVLAQSKLKEALTPLDDAKRLLSNRRLEWENEQELIRVKQQRRAQAEADRIAEEERQKAGVQLTMGEIDNALAEGNEAKAEELLSNPIQTPGVYVPPVHVESQVPKQAGISRRKNWVAEISGYPDDLDEFEKLILDVAEGICDRAKTGSLKGHAPTKVLEPNFTALNQLAKAQEMALNYPGVRAYNKPIESVRRKK